jgi:hypothetical protein
MTIANCKPSGDLRWLLRLYAGGLLLLIAVTIRLWTGWHHLPQVPAFRWAIRLPDVIDLVLLAGILGAPIRGLTARHSRLLWPMIATAIGMSVLLDQHRCQVWTYHLLVAGFIGAFSDPTRALERLRWLTIGIYAWSAISKCDVSFVSGPGKLLWEGLLHAINIDAASLPAPFNRLAPWLMPAGELLTAIALAFPRWQRVGLWLSIAMHAALLLAVGPLGLRHEVGVQIWNVLFIVQNIILFRRAAADEKPGFSLQRQSPAALNVEATSAEAGLLNMSLTRPPRSLGDRAAASLLLVVLLIPAFQPWNLWDVWPSWAVYSTRGGWTTIFVHHDDVDLLPVAARRFVREPPPLSDWHPVDIDAWSLAELHCPVYPQSRFRLGVAAALSEVARIRVERRSPPNRWTGTTTVETIDATGGALPEEVEREFWLNVRPRAATR